MNDDLIERGAEAACLVLNPGSPWEYAPDTVKDTYRELAAAVLEACGSAHVSAHGGSDAR